MTLTQASELVAILTDYERHAPLDDKAVRISVVNDLAFVEVGNVKEEAKSTTFTAVESVGVDAELLLHTLTAMVRRADRFAADKHRQGEGRADDPLLAAVPVQSYVPATRRRA
jgi:hypothetical protein